MLILMGQPKTAGTRFRWDPFEIVPITQRYVPPLPRLTRRGSHSVAKPAAEDLSLARLELADH